MACRLGSRSATVTALLRTVCTYRTALMLPSGTAWSRASSTSADCSAAELRLGVDQRSRAETVGFITECRARENALCGLPDEDERPRPAESPYPAGKQLVYDPNGQEETEHDAEDSNERVGIMHHSGAVGRETAAHEDLDEPFDAPQGPFGSVHS
jgi:hypothetical protein